MNESRSAGADVPRSKWPMRIGLTIAALLGGLLFLFFLAAFLNLWTTTASFSPIQALVYFGTPALEVFAFLLVLFMARGDRGRMARSLVMVIWLANILNMVLAARGVFGI